MRIPRKFKNSSADMARTTSGLLELASTGRIEGLGT
jgi:hypothetical protein